MLGKDPDLLLFLWVTPIAHSIAGGRTRVFGLLFLSVIYYLLIKTAKKNSRQLFIIPVIFFLWGNFHGSFILGLAVLIFFVVSQKSKKYFVVLVASTLATFINPYFLNLWKQAIIVPLNSYGIKDINPDWQSIINFQNNGWIFALFAILLLTAIRVFKPKLDIKTQILLFFSLLVSFISSRFSIALLVFFIPSLFVLIEFFKRKFMQGVLNQIPVKVSLLASILVLFLLAIQNVLGLKFAYGSYQSYSHFLTTHSPAGLSHYAWPSEANWYISKNARDKRVFNEANWGGYMLLFDKNQKLFFYTAMDNFLVNGRSFAFTYLDIVGARQGFKENLEKYHIESVFLPKNYPLVIALKTDPEWSVVYEDDQATVLTKN